MTSVLLNLWSFVLWPSVCFLLVTALCALENSVLQFVVGMFLSCQLCLLVGRFKSSVALTIFFVLFLPTTEAGMWKSQTSFMGHFQSSVLWMLCFMCLESLVLATCIVRIIMCS
jgi:hypothetical protein